MSSSNSPIDNTQPWLTIVGIGEDGWEGLTPSARQAIDSAKILYGGARHLAFIPSTAARSIPWPSPLAPAVKEILTVHRGRSSVVVLASGDPMLYGVGVPLTRSLDRSEYRVIPGVSAFSLACARMGWPTAETPLVSLVNRPIEELNRHLRPGQRLMIYSEDGTTPGAVARMLVSSGYGASRFEVFESLGGPAEKHHEAEARSWPQDRCGDLNAIAVHCVADPGARPLPLIPGLTEDAFETDGQLTKREVRAITLARLAPLPGQHLWDVGAGTGTIGIEWMRSHPSCACTAFEAREDRAQNIAANAKKLGTPGLRVILGAAPESFGGNRQPDAIFIGGGLSHENLFESCWTALPSGGHLVVNAVTLSSEARLVALQQEFGGDLVRIEIARAEAVGNELGWRPVMPITQWAVVKP
ncbi:MAG TPA: precorrin-6y C5,15-methyltransferase (decarboxylating) subunit CbiE [Acidobacteriaceae bacterium]